MANNIIANFRARVLSYPNSIFEAGPCLDATLEELNAVGLLDDASLIVTPNAYNEGVLYDVIPNTPLGDMDVVRATTATRVNSAGLIEVVPRNLYQSSNDFTNFNWSKVNSTITTNQVGYDGTNNASLLVENSTTNAHRIQQTPSLSGQTTISVYAKANTRNWLYLRGVQAGSQVVGWFNLSNGTLGTIQTNGTGSITSVGDGWYRCSLTVANFATGFETYIGISNANTVDSYLGNGSSIFIQNAQVESFPTATEYFPTTTRLNIPRIDYTNGSCPSLLVEPQRTNVVNYSEEFNNAYWNKLETTVTENTTNSPSGILNADSLIESTSNGRHMIYKAFTSVIGTSYTLSVFCKQNTRRYANINLKTTTTASPRFSALFDLQTGTNVSTSSVGSPTGTSFSIVPYANGWYKISITMNAASTSTELEISASNTSTPTLSEGSPSYLGDGTSGIYLWGAQLEVGAYPTSYIPTVASSVTRNADVISKTGISSLIGQTEGTVFLNVKALANDNTTRQISISDNSFNNYVRFSFAAVTNFATASLISTGTTQASNDFSLNQTNTNKIAIKYNTNLFEIYVNGVLIHQDLSVNTFSGSTLSSLQFSNPLGGSIWCGNLNSLQLYKTALTDEQCVLLTGDLYDSYAEMANSLNYILE